MDMNSLAPSKSLRADRFHGCLWPAAACVISLYALLSGGQIARAQSATVEERFRQATEAMREAHLDEAAKGFAWVIGASPGFAEAHFNLGLVLEQQGKNEEAIASFQKALALKPRLHGAHLFLGVAEYRLNQFDKAIAALRQETIDYPSDANAWMWLGVAELANEQAEDAAEALDKAAKLAPDNVDILYHRGRAHLLVSKESYARMLKADPKSWRVHQVLAQADAEAGRHEEAIAEYLASIELAPNQPGLHEGLGTEYRMLGKMDEAEAALEREAEIDPHNLLALYKLGTLEVERDNGAKGKALIEAALAQNPRLKQADYYLGRAEMELGNNAASLRALERAVSVDSDPETLEQAWYQLGIVYRRMHRMREAEQAMATFQKLKDEEAQRHLERVEKKRGAEAAQSAPSHGSPKNP